MLYFTLTKKLKQQQLKKSIMQDSDEYLPNLVSNKLFWKIALYDLGWPWPHFDLPCCLKCFLSAWEVKNKLFEKLHLMTLDELLPHFDLGWPFPYFDLPWCLNCFLSAWEVKNKLEKLHLMTLDDLDLILTLPSV